MKVPILAAATLALLSACSAEAPTGGEATGEAGAAVPQQEVQAASTASGDEGPSGNAETAEAKPAAAPAKIEGITNERLSFAPGASSAIVESSITGYEIIDYLLNVKAGQPMNISMATQNPSAYFNLLEPGETEVAIFNGSIGENQYEGVAEKSGDYRIRVYMMRSAARRNEKANYRLEAIVRP